MKSADALWRYVSERGLRPLPKTSVSEWADSYRMLSNTSAEPGRWKTSRAPYQKEIMDAFTQPGVHEVVVKSCSQIGKSDIMNNVIGRFAHLDPCSIMMVQPTVDMAEDFSKSRIEPMIQDTKVLTALFSDTGAGIGVILSCRSCSQADGSSWGAPTVRLDWLPGPSASCCAMRWTAFLSQRARKGTRWTLPANV